MAEVHAVWMYPVLTVLGTAIGAYGALIGAGGGVLLVPVLLFTYPQESSNTIASISLAAVFFNTLSGTLAYGHMRRIDYRAGLLFAAAAAPGPAQATGQSMRMSAGQSVPRTTRSAPAVSITIRRAASLWVRQS